MGPARTSNARSNRTQGRRPRKHETGLDPSNTSALLVATSESGGVVDPPVIVMVGPKHPLSFGGVYEQPT